MFIGCIHSGVSQPSGSPPASGIFCNTKNRLRLDLTSRQKARPLHTRSSQEVPGRALFPQLYNNNIIAAL
ncbi:Uncharacterized protein HZ326_25414 [Fusarium oxysporum f. sp. albedinis]|nr:Uncharacterized protein HZ326_25414 [Fusarium oxysporum f. sp. albedinis]